MKTRILHTKIYDDSWFRSLDLPKKFLFVYLFTNHRIGHTGIYEIGTDTITFEAGIDQVEVISAIKTFSETNKVLSHNGWVYVVKSSLYGGYTGEKNELAYTRELASIPLEVKEYFNGIVPIPYLYGMHTLSEENNTPINHKPEIINDKSETINHKSQIDVMRKKLKGKLKI